MNNSLSQRNSYYIKDISINKKIISYFICFIFIIEPKIFTQYSTSVYIFSTANLFIFCLYFLKTQKYKTKFTNTLYLWFVFCIYSLISKTTSGDFSFIFSWGYLTIMVANIIMIFNEAYKSNKLLILLKSIMLVGILYLSINLITLFVYNRGIIRSNFYDGTDGDWYFLGIKTQYPMYIFSFIACATTYKILTKKNILCALVYVLGTLNLFISKGSTGIIMFCFMIALFLIMKISHNLNINIKITLCIFIIVNILFVFCNFSSLFSNFFAIFGKDATMSARTSIWFEGKNVLVKNPIRIIIGYGSINNGSWVPINNGLWYSHNCLLQNLHENGILGLILLFLFLIYGTSRVSSSRKYCYSVALRYLNTLCFIIIISTITEDIFATAYTFIPFLLVKYINFYLMNRKNIAICKHKNFNQTF